MHSGGRYVSMEELATIEPPPGTSTWYPVKHSTVLDTTCELLDRHDFRVGRVAAAVARGDHRFFATIDLRSEIAPGVALSVGVRSSTDKSFPLNFIAGNRVFVCDNLAFHGTIKVTRKHTRNGAENWQEGILESVKGLDAFVQEERRRITTLKLTRLDDKAADHLIIEALRDGLINSRMVLPIADQWRNPDHHEFQPRTAWSLHNAFTEVLKPVQARDINRFAIATSKLYPMLVNSILN
jgi:hypothetical protein